MPSRKRVIYQSEALFVGPTGGGPTGDHNQLHRVQSANYSFEVARTDVNEFGRLARIDSIIVEQPTVSLDFSYFQIDGTNEENLGLTVSTSGAGAVAALSGILAGNGQDVKNYYIYVASEGSDAQGFAGTPKAIGIGNGFLSSFSAEASVGDIPTTTVNVEGLNMRFTNDVTNEPNPAVNPVDGSDAAGTFSLPVPNSGTMLTTALRPGDISFALADAAIQGATHTDLKIQSFTLSFDLSREPLEKLGSKFAFSKEIEFPVTATLAIEAVLGDIEAETLSDLVNNDSSTHNLLIRINKPGSNPATTSIAYEIRGAKLDSQDFSSSIGDNKSVSLSFSTQINAPEDTANGIFIYNG